MVYKCNISIWKENSFLFQSHALIYNFLDMSLQTKLSSRNGSNNIRTNNNTVTGVLKGPFFSHTFEGSLSTRSWCRSGVSKLFHLMATLCILQIFVGQKNWIYKSPLLHPVVPIRFPSIHPGEPKRVPPYIHVYPAKSPLRSMCIRQILPLHPCVTIRVLLTCIHNH